MQNNKKVTAIVLAAGLGSRFDKKFNKVFAKLNGLPILYYSLKKFSDNPKVDEIIVAINPLEEKQIRKFLIKFNFEKQVIIVYGGKTRRESVNNGLKKANGNIIIIQDGARPMLKQDYIEKCLEEIQNFKAVSVAVKSKDTIKVTDDRGIVKTTTLRRNTWLIQTPQCFDKKILFEAYEKYLDNEDITDDCMLIELEKLDVKLIEGDYTNLKVTTKEDIEILKTFLKN